MPTQKWLIPDQTTSQDLSSAALDYTTSIGRKFKLESITVHFSVAVTETITIKRNSAYSSNYDAKLAEDDLVSAQDYVFRPRGECNFQEGEEIDIDITNANATGVAYVTVKCQELLM